MSSSAQNVTRCTSREQVWRDALLEREQQLFAKLTRLGDAPRRHLSARVSCLREDARTWLALLPECSVHAVLTDPPYGLTEYHAREQRKLRAGCGGVWRIPPRFDGARRRPLPRFTVLSARELAVLEEFFGALAGELLRVLVPGGHLLLASNPLLSSLTFSAIQRAGLEKRGEIVRLAQTLRGGDRPKGAEREFADVAMMPRACWEPWGVFRKPLEGTAAENLRRWGTGGLRRISAAQPFKDVIACPPAREPERRLAAHPSLKPQRLMRPLARAVLPLGIGILCDPFAGSGATLAAAEHQGLCAIGTERDPVYFRLACGAFGALSRLRVSPGSPQR